MKNLTILLILTLAPIWMKAQNLEVEGKVKIIDMETVNNSADSVVIRQSDGTLALRDISDLVAQLVALGGVRDVDNN